MSRIFVYRDGGSIKKRHLTNCHLCGESFVHLTQIFAKNGKYHSTRYHIKCAEKLNMLGGWNV